MNQPEARKAGNWGFRWPEAVELTTRDGHTLKVSPKEYMKSRDNPSLTDRARAALRMYQVEMPDGKVTDLSELDLMELVEEQ